MAKARLFVGRRSGSAGVHTQNLAASMQSVLGNFMDFCKHIEEITPELLVDALEPTFQKSQTYVPRQSGELAASGYLEVEKRANGAEAVMGYGRNGNPGYAIYVHELPATHQAPQRDKFLQAAVEEDYYDIADRVARGYAQTVGGS